MPGISLSSIDGDNDACTSSIENLVRPAGWRSQGSSGPDADAMVFVVDDDVPVRESLENLLRSVGLRVELFASAHEFLATKRPDVPGCLVLDVGLPGLSGLDLQRRLAEIGMEIPIIFITGQSDIPISVRAMKAGAVEFLIKPFGDQDLIDAIRQGIERDRVTRRRAAKLTEANEALRGCLDSLDSVPDVDDFLGQLIAAITRQLGASSAALFLRNDKPDFLTLKLAFHGDRVVSPEEANYPENLRLLRLDERLLGLLKQPVCIASLHDDTMPIGDTHRSYLLGIGVKTLLIIPLIIARELIGSLTFRFMEQHKFRPEEIEIARVLAAQTSLAIQLTRLAETSKQSAVLEERNRLAGEIHDSLAQSFAGIAIHLSAAEEEMAAGKGSPLRRVRFVNRLAELGLAEARRSALSLRSTLIEESGLVEGLRMLVERWNVMDRVRCCFRTGHIPEERLPVRIQHELLRIAQEAISNAVRHGKPTVVSVTVRWETTHLTLQIKDNGSGISLTRPKKNEGIGLRSMRERAAQIGAKLAIQADPRGGTRLVVTVPISL
jgi:two-component system NarL family sensor kinase